MKELGWVSLRKQILNKFFVASQETPQFLSLAPLVLAYVSLYIRLVTRSEKTHAHKEECHTLSYKVRGNEVRRRETEEKIVPVNLGKRTRGSAGNSRLFSRYFGRGNI